ncbi:CapA family protein [Paenibacillus rhizoplanae]
MSSSIGGRERMEQYDKTQQALGHSFIDAGADLVMGGHPHVLQGIEPYKGKMDCLQHRQLYFHTRLHSGYLGDGGLPGGMQQAGAMRS